MTEHIQVFTQNSIRIAAEAGVVYIDPFRMEEEPKDADFILITHDHYDHFSPEDIGKVCNSNSVLVVPEKMREKAAEVADLVGRIETVRPGETKEIDGLLLETVPAYNILKPFHPKGAKWVGYIVTDRGTRIYIAGDTDATKEALEVKCDVALVPIGGTYTMDAKKAAAFINEIRPAVAIPVHYGEIVGDPKDGEVFAGLVADPIRTEIRIQNK